MGLMEKRRFKNFLQFAYEYEADKPATQSKSFIDVLCMNKIPSLLSEGVDPKSNMKAAYTKFGLDDNTMSFTGHALALHRDDK